MIVVTENMAYLYLVALEPQCDRCGQPANAPSYNEDTQIWYFGHFVHEFNHGLNSSIRRSVKKAVQRWSGLCLLDDADYLGEFPIDHAKRLA